MKAPKDNTEPQSLTFDDANVMARVDKAHHHGCSVRELRPRSDLENGYILSYTIVIGFGWPASWIVIVSVLPSAETL